MKRLLITLFCLFFAAPALCECRFGVPHAELHDEKVLFSTALLSDEPVYLILAEARLGGVPLEIEESSLSDQWHGNPLKGETAILGTRGFSAALPQNADPGDELTVRVVAMRPFQGVMPIDSSREGLWAAIDTALAEKLTPVDADEPYTVYFGTDWLHEVPGESGDDSALAVPLNSASLDPQRFDGQLAKYANLMPAGGAAYTPTLEELPVYTPAAPVLLKLQGSAQPISLLLQDDGQAVYTDVPQAKVSPEDAALTGIAALQEAYELTDDFFSGCTAGYTLVEELTDRGYHTYWAVNLWRDGLPTDHTAFVDANTGEVLDLSGPGEGNG